MQWQQQQQPQPQFGTLPRGCSSSSSSKPVARTNALRVTKCTHNGIFIEQMTETISATERGRDKGRVRRSEEAQSRRPVSFLPLCVLLYCGCHFRALAEVIYRFELWPLNLGFKFIQSGIKCAAEEWYNSFIFERGSTLCRYKRGRKRDGERKMQRVREMWNGKGGRIKECREFV